MNTAKIATLYPYFLDALQQLHTERSLEDMLGIVQHAQHVLSLRKSNSPCLWVKLRDNENPVLRYNELGMATDEALTELVPARVFEWVCRQQPTTPTYNDLSERTGWRVVANEVMPVPRGIPGQPVPAETKGCYLIWTGSNQQVGQLLRGLYALRTKRRKQTRRLIAQLRAYHLRQVLQRATEATPVVLAAA